MIKNNQLLITIFVIIGAGSLFIYFFCFQPRNFSFKDPIGNQILDTNNASVVVGRTNPIDETKAAYIETTKPAPASSNNNVASTHKMIPEKTGGTNQPVELFKVVIETNIGIYYATDAERRNLYLKDRFGNTAAKGDIVEFLNEKPRAANDDRKIDSMKIIDGHLEISFGGSNYLFNLQGGQGKN